MLRLEQRPANPYPLVAVPRPAQFPLSIAQEWLWRQDRPLARHQDHVTGGWRLTERLDRQAFSGAVDELLVRHEILRTRFVLDRRGEPVQEVTDAGSVPVTWAGTDWREPVDRSVVEPFDLSAPPLFRVVAADLRDGAHGVFMSVHHIIADRWSMDVLARDLFELYDARRRRREANLPSCAVQYGDYALWQRRLLRSDLIKPSLDYWQQALHGYSRRQLPASRARSSARDTIGRELVIELPARATEAITAAAWRTRASPAIAVTATLCALLRAWTGQRDVVVGAMVSDRSRPELQDVIGPALNAIALRIDLSSPALTFRQLVRRTRDAWMTALAHQDVPFGPIEQALSPSSPDRPPFDAMVNHGGGWPGADACIPAPWDPAGPAIGTFEFALCTLMLNTLMVGDRLRLAFVYRPSQFDHATIAELASRYSALLRHGAADVDQVLILDEMSQP